MPKLQSIKRVNGSIVFMLNLPKEHIESLDWSKGDRIEVRELNDGLFLWLGDS